MATAISWSAIALSFITTVGCAADRDSSTLDRATQDSIEQSELDSIAAAANEKRWIEAQGVVQRVPRAAVASLSNADLFAKLDTVGHFSISSRVQADSAAARWLAAARTEGARRRARVRLDTILAKECSPPRRRIEQLLQTHADWSDDHIADVACRLIWVGMSEEQLRASWGRPERINRSVYPSGVHAQWVYGDDYVYVESGVVTSYQTSR